jgi:dihydrolipoamide dehydrogenase
MKHFLAIIGGGPAGYTAAEIASRAGKDVILFEQNALGGTCLNIGCIPTKTLLYSAKQYYNAKNATKYGVAASAITVTRLGAASSIPLDEELREVIKKEDLI